MNASETQCATVGFAVLKRVLRTCYGGDVRLLLHCMLEHLV